MEHIEVPDHWTDKDYERFIKKTRHLENGCILWTGSRSKDGKGYALFNIDGKTRVVHVYLWKHLIGEYEGHLDHTCRNMGCINLGCLEVVTPRENVVIRGTGITAQNILKTHCPKGHEYTEANTYIDNTNRRHCRECSRVQARKWKRENAERVSEYRIDYYYTKGR
jgi:hypothetical protein